ncbi:hypothetical protein [Bacillus sp. MUM 13]|uniref:hypothetical protein n=1 Tax=Bacillus sp. MUM 13 TaxID=1678001 RepID=UPI0008F5D96D|nr:hypothetical protein [Bacillus sp. MUM 13]OIK08644.1 hypothetical protein BIV59_19440 [Bacillus sp. MUM 13]
MNIKKLLFKKIQYNVSGLISNSLGFFVVVYFSSAYADRKWTYTSVLLIILFLLISCLFFSYLEIVLSRLLGKKNIAVGQGWHIFVISCILFLYYFIIQ